MNDYINRNVGKEGKEGISLALRIQESANDCEQVLDFYDFLCFSAIFAAAEGASKKLQKALVNRKDKLDNWPKEKKKKASMEGLIEERSQAVCHFALRNIDDSFAQFGRLFLISLCTAFEKRVKEMLFVSHAASLKNIMKGDIKDGLNNSRF